MDAIRFNAIPSTEHVPQVMWVDVQPSSTVTEQSPVEFLVPGAGNQYFSLPDTELYVKFHILHEDGTPLPEADPGEPFPDMARVAPINNFLHSLWRQIDVFWGDRLVSSSGMNYPHKSIVDLLLSDGREAKDTQLQAQLYYKDTANFLGDINYPESGNEGMVARGYLTKQSRKVDMHGPLNIDVFQGQTSLLLNGVNVRIKLWPSSTVFKLVSSMFAPKPAFKVVLDNVLLRVCKVQVNPTVFLENEKQLQRCTAKYPYLKADITTRTLEQGQTALVMENLFQGRIPAKLCVGLLPTANYNGSYLTNPYHFQHANLNYLAAYVDGVSMPGVPFEPNFEENNYIREYLSMFRVADKLYRDAGNDIGRADYPAGYTLYGLDIDPEAQSTLKRRRGNFKVEIRLKSGPTENFTVLLYAMYPEIIEIDQTRNIQLST